MLKVQLFCLVPSTRIKTVLRFRYSFFYNGPLVIKLPFSGKTTQWEYWLLFAGVFEGLVGVEQEMNVARCGGDLMTEGWCNDAR